MFHEEKNVSVSAAILVLVVVANVLVIKAAFVHDNKWYWLMIITLPLLAAVINNLRRERQR
jgi:hypothetical protein